MRFAETELLHSPESFTVVDGVGMFRPAGKLHWQQAVAEVTRGIAHARALHLEKLLIVTTGLEGFKAPSVAARLELAREWAQAADGHVTMAVVARREFIDSERIGVVAAARMGARSSVFESEAAAMEWLREH